MLSREVAWASGPGGQHTPQPAREKQPPSLTLTHIRDTSRCLTDNSQGLPAHTLILQQHVAAVVLLSQVQAPPLLLGQVHGHVLQGHRHLLERSSLRAWWAHCPLYLCDDGRSCLPPPTSSPPQPFPFCMLLCTPSFQAWLRHSWILLFGRTPSPPSSAPTAAGPETVWTDVLRGTSGSAEIPATGAHAP